MPQKIIELAITKARNYDIGQNIVFYRKILLNFGGGGAWAINRPVFDERINRS